MSYSDKFEEILQDNKTPIVTSLLGVVFTSIILSIRKNTKGTRDFGYAKSQLIPFLANNHKYTSWIWATRAFALSTSIVGLTSLGLGLAISNYMQVSSLKEFSVKFRAAIARNFPAIVITNPDVDDEAGVEFMREFLADLNQEQYQESAANQFIAGRVRKVLGIDKPPPY